MNQVAFTGCIWLDSPHLKPRSSLTMGASASCLEEHGAALSEENKFSQTQFVLCTEHKAQQTGLLTICSKTKEKMAMKSCGIWDLLLKCRHLPIPVLIEKKAIWTFYTPAEPLQQTGISP